MDFMLEFDRAVRTVKAEDRARILKSLEKRKDADCKRLRRYLCEIWGIESGGEGDLRGDSSESVKADS